MRGGHHPTWFDFRDPGVQTARQADIEDTVDIWGYCEHCDRWFRCPMDRAADWTCASCGIEPIRIENRTAERAG